MELRLFMNSVSVVGGQFYRHFSSTSVCRGNCYRSVKELPGPVNLPVIGTYWQYLIGTCDMLHMDKVGDDYYRKYGAMVYERLGPFSLVHLYKPQHFEQVINATFSRPVRKSFLAIARYRRYNPEKYSSLGILPSNNEEWWKLRQAFQKPISPLKETRDFLEPTDEITEEFVRSIKPEQTIHDFMTLANRLNMECSVNSFDESNNYISGVISTVIALTEGLAEQDRAEMSWGFVRNKSFKRVESLCCVLEQFCQKMINKVMAREDLHSNRCVMAQFMSDASIDEKELVGACIDLLMGGIHTTSIVSSFLIYRMSKSEISQSKMREEAFRLLPTPDSRITRETLDGAVFTRAVVKEILRLNPITHAQVRMLTSHLIIDNFKLPKNTMVFLHVLSACRLECNFKDALQFKPERWIKDSPEYEDSNPYLVIPFSLGLRSCIARRRAEQNLLVLTLRLFREYSVKWMRDADLGVITPAMMTPDAPVSVMFTRHS